MTRKSLRILLPILLLGLLLGASSTAHADAIAITSLSFSNLQITAASGTVLFNPTGANAVAQATNSLGQNSQNMSNSLPIAQTNAGVVFASASGLANTTTFTANANSFVSVTGCTCEASSIGRASLSGTFVILGGEGNVNVTISSLLTTMQSVFTDQFGQAAQSFFLFNLQLDNSLSSIGTFFSVGGPNSVDGRPAMIEMLNSVALQFNVPHTITIELEARSSAANEIPEPASAVLLLSGLGFVAGCLRKRRKTTPTP